MRTNNRNVKKSPCSIICHGASEVEIAKFLRFKFRFKIQILCKSNGAQNIELPSLMNYLNKTFPTKDSYIKYLNKKSGSFESEDLDNHKIFILIDLDGYNDFAKRFMNKSMFDGYWAKDIIVPILADPNLDVCFEKIGFNLMHGSKPVQYHKFLNCHNYDFFTIINRLPKESYQLFKLVEYLSKYKD